MRSTALVAVLLFAGACSIPQVEEDLAAEAPPPELGRPGWIRGGAGIGAWAGGIVGGVGSIFLLPITLPIGWLADEPLGYSKEEFTFAPVSAAASAGHFAIGAPLDMLDFVFYRAWFADPPEKGYSWTPMKPPVGPGPAEGVPPPADDEVDPTGSGA